MNATCILQKNHGRTLENDRDAASNSSEPVRVRRVSARPAELGDRDAGEGEHSETDRTFAH